MWELLGIFIFIWVSYEKPSSSYRAMLYSNQDAGEIWSYGFWERRVKFWVCSKFRGETKAGPSRAVESGLAQSQWERVRNSDAGGCGGLWPPATKATRNLFDRSLKVADCLPRELSCSAWSHTNLWRMTRPTSIPHGPTWLVGSWHSRRLSVSLSSPLCNGSRQKEHSVRWEW